jgi:hypothetical protein
MIKSKTTSAPPAEAKALEAGGPRLKLQALAARGARINYARCRLSAPGMALALASSEA